MKLPDENKEELVNIVKQFDDPVNLVTIKREVGTRTDLSRDDKLFLCDILDCKADLLPLTMGEEQIGNTLKGIFGRLSLSKPKIALRVKNHINIEDLSARKQAELRTLIAGIFEP